MPTRQGRPKTVAQHARVTAGADQRMFHATLTQYRNATFHCVALGNAAQVYTHALTRKGDGTTLIVNRDETVVNRPQRILHDRFVWLDPLAIVIKKAHAGIGNVEGAPGTLGDRLLPF